MSELEFYYGVSPLGFQKWLIVTTRDRRFFRTILALYGIEKLRYLIKKDNYSLTFVLFCNRPYPRHATGL